MQGVKKVSNEGSVTPQKGPNLPAFTLHLSRMSKRFGPLPVRGSTQEKWPSEIFRFGYRKAANDKKVPDPVGSGPIKEQRDRFLGKFETRFFMSLRQTASLPPIMSLHRYWVYANRMRENFEAALTKSPRNFTNLAKETDLAKATVAAATFAIGPGIFMSYRYGSLYVVIEGWKQLRLTDPKIDPLLLSPNVRLLKKYRDGVFHFQRNYFDDRFIGFVKAEDSVQWVRTIHSELGEYFRREIPLLDPMVGQSDPEGNR